MPILLSKFLCSGQVSGFPNHCVVFLGFEAMGIGQPLLDNPYSKMRDINPDPLASKLLCCVYGRAATTEGIEDGVPGIG